MTLITDSDVSFSTEAAASDRSSSDSDNESVVNEEYYVLNAVSMEEPTATDVAIVTSTETNTINPKQQHGTSVIRVAILGCGMMGQEHCSYIMGYSKQLRIDFLCDPHQPSIDKCLHVMKEFRHENHSHEQQYHHPIILSDENDLLNNHVFDIDLLVIATPNYLHTDAIIRWGQYDHLTILVEKPVAVSYEQHARLSSHQEQLKANIWVAMEYRFIPAIAKLIELIPDVVGDIHMVTIRENRYPFLHKVNKWNRDYRKTGDTLVEKCCHFFDLMRLITGQEAQHDNIKSMVQRGINYGDEDNSEIDVPIIDSAYVILPFEKKMDHKTEIVNDNKKATKRTMGCLELCMFSEGSRHQEEIIVTGSHGRLEAYLPENKVYAYKRPTHKEWNDRNVPPPKEVIQETIYDCSNVKDVHGIQEDDNEPNGNHMPTHSGYHYSSTAVEWYRLLDAMQHHQETDVWKPLVSLDDGLKAVDIGLHATTHIV